MTTHTFTKTIDSVDIPSGNVEITYTPTDTSLSAVSYNVSFQKVPDFRTLRDENNNLLYATEADVPFSEHLNYTVNSAAPHSFWTRQKYMIDNAASLQAEISN
jgi:hypothetical protein